MFTYQRIKTYYVPPSIIFPTSVHSNNSGHNMNVFATYYTSKFSRGHHLGPPPLLHELPTFQSCSGLRRTDYIPLQLFLLHQQHLVLYLARQVSTEQPVRFLPTLPGLLTLKGSVGAWAGLQRTPATKFQGS